MKMGITVNNIILTALTRQFDKQYKIFRNITISLTTIEAIFIWTCWNVFLDAALFLLEVVEFIYSLYF